MGGALRAIQDIAGGGDVAIRRDSERQEWKERYRNSR